MAAKSGWKPIAVASSKHEALLKKVGAVALVDYTKDDVEQRVAEVVGAEHLNGAVHCAGPPETIALCSTLVKALGDPRVDLVVSTTASGELPVPPDGVKAVGVELGGLELREDGPPFLKKNYPLIPKLKAMPIRLIKSPVTAEVVQETFQLSKDGLSGEKIVIEWIP